MSSSFKALFFAWKTHDGSGWCGRWDIRGDEPLHQLHNPYRIIDDPPQAAQLELYQELLKEHFLVTLLEPNALQDEVRFMTC